MPGAPKTSSDRRAQLEQLFAERILVIYGAMGTMLQRADLSEADFRGEGFADHPRELTGDNDLLVLTRPDVVRGIHDAYPAAGADLIETNTFNATRIAQADYGMKAAVPEINRRAAELAVEVARTCSERTPDKPRFAAGAVGPTSKTLSISPDVSDASFRDLDFDALRDAYAEQIRALVEGGVDVLLIETIFDTLNAKAAIVAAHEVFDALGREIPLMLSVTITDKSGRTLSSQTIEAFWVSVAHARPLSVGINCALGATEMRPFLADLAAVASVPVTAYPNAGLPNAFGGYDETPGDHGLADPGVRGERPRQRRGRLLRHHRSPHPGHRAGRGRRRAPQRAAARGAGGALQRPRAPGDPPGFQLHDDRRAHQRHRLAPLRQPDQEGRLHHRR